MNDNENVNNTPEEETEKDREASAEVTIDTEPEEILAETDAPAEETAVPASAKLPSEEADAGKKLVNIFSELDSPDAEQDEPAHHETADEPEPVNEPEPEREFVDEAEVRRRMIEHRRNTALSADEIADRKRAHAERHAKGQGSGKKKKKKGSPSSGKKQTGSRKASAERPGRGKDHPAGRKKTKPGSSPAAKKAAEETVDMEDFRRARNKLKSKKRTKRLIILLAVAAVAAGVFFTKGLWIPKLEGILDKPHETIVNDSTEQAGNFPLDTGDSTVRQLTSLDGSIVSADASHITTYDTGGKLRDSVYHGCGSPELRSSGKRMLCFDFGGTGFKLYSKSGLMFEKQVNGTVLLGSIASNGNVAVVSQDSKYIVTVNVYDKNGEDVYHWSNGDRVLDVCFTGDGSGLIVTTFSAAGGKLSSVIHRIDMTKSGSVSESDKLEGFILRACETKDGNIWAMGEDRLWLLSQSCRSLSSYEFNVTPASFDLSAECVCAACNNVSGGTNVYMFSADNLELKPKIIESSEGSIKKVHCFDGMAFVLSSDKLDAYGPDGSLVSTAAVSNDHSDFVYSENAAYFIDRHEISKLIFKT